MEVEVIKAKNKFDDSAKQRYKDRLRVAAYCLSLIHISEPTRP